MKTDVQFAQDAVMKPIQEIADGLGIHPEAVEPYGRYKAKIDLRKQPDLGDKTGKLVLVTAINPTPAGEGKTTTNVGLSMALNKMGKRPSAL